MNKEFVLVSQGIEIMRTKSQEKAINEVKRGNDEWFDYCQRCADNYERPADNYIELFIETDYEKKLESENTKLKQALNEIREYIAKDIQKCTYGQVSKYQDILQIIDEVGGNEE